MYNGPPDMMNVPQGTPYVTKLKTKILFRMDYVLQCKTDEEALNGWRLLCADGYALVRLAVQEGRLEGIPNSDMWKDIARNVLSKWPPKTYQKTDLVRETDGYRGQYDHYCVEVRTIDLDKGLQSLKEEKYNVIANEMMAFWGDCYSIAMIVNYLDMNELIEIPVQRSLYSDKDISGELASRSGFTRPLKGNPIPPK